MPRELTDEHNRQIKEAFDMFDHNHDDRLEFYELKFAMQALGFEPTRSDITKLLTVNPATNRKQVTRKNFTDEMRRRISLRDPAEEIRMAFSLFDVNNTGKIDFNQLKAVCVEVGDSISDDEIRAMIDVFDMDQDGAIDLDDFMAICEGL